MKQFFFLATKQIEQKSINFYYMSCRLARSSEAQLRVAMLGGVARPREYAREDRPGGGRGTRTAARAREKRRSRARDRRRADPGLWPRR